MLTRKHNGADFIEKAHQVHPNKGYDYSLVNYLGTAIKVIIKCPVHQEFTQTPNNHINLGRGCSKCSLIRTQQSRRLNTDKFVSLANVRHNNIYEYPRSVYIDAVSQIIITCKEHGDFSALASNHIKKG